MFDHEPNFLFQKQFAEMLINRISEAFNYEMSFNVLEKIVI